MEDSRNVRGQSLVPQSADTQTTASGESSVSELTKFRALYDLAVAMTAERSLDENLQMVADQARSLLGADKAFIALAEEPSGDLVMHTFSGIVTDEFKQVRIPAGVGLGGEVARTGAPRVVNDYYEEFEPRYHEVMRAEGLVAGIAVPIRTGARNLGVLYSFNKRKRPFARDDLETLSLLGNLAAVEIIRRRSEQSVKEGQERYRDLYERSKSGEELYRSVLNSSVDAIVIYDMEGRAQYVSPSFTRTFGWTLDDVKGERIPFLPDSEREPTMAIINGLIETGEPCSAFETKRCTRDGRLLDTSISASRYHDHQGAPAGILVIIRDITARKRAERDLAVELNKFQALYDLALAMTVERTLDENLQIIVEKSRALLGADKACMALRDETSGDLHMQVYSGIRTQAFKRLRIPFGVGLGGMVAETGRRHIVEDYFSEIGPEFHDIARDEGLLSGIAVPVKIGETNLGVLYVFNRRRTPFSLADLDTLSLLGNLAAVEITRRQAKVRLRESEERYRTLYEESKEGEELYRSVLNSSVDGIVVYDLEGAPRYVNPSFERMYGWTIEDLEGARIPFVPEPEKEETIRVISELVKTGRPTKRFETRRYTKDGRLLDISISASRYHDHQGRPAGTLTVHRDITDRKRAEQALRESEERFRTLAETAPFGLVVVGADDRAEYINPKFTEIFGYSFEDVPDLQTWFEKAYPDPQQRRHAAAVWNEETAGLFGNRQSSAEAEPRQFTVRRKDGGETIVSFRAVVLPGRRIIATFLDITAEARAQREVQRAKTEWERTFNAVQDLILILDSQRRVVRANKALAARFEITPEEMIGAGCDQPLKSDRTLAPLCPMGPSGEDAGDQFLEVTDDGLGGVFDLRVSPMRDEQGRFLGTAHIGRDITAFKAMERARRRAVHHLSHELKTPIAVLKASIRSLTEPDLEPEARDRKIERIRRNLGRLTDIQRIVQEIVAPPKYRPRRFPVAEHVHDILEESRRMSAHRSVAIEERLEPVDTDVIDPDALTTVLRTLVKNAVENTPDGGEVVVSISRRARGALLTVADTGVGIPPGDREFLFNAFHHTKDTEQYATKTPYDFDAGGKGLELMRLQVPAEEGGFDVSFETERCRFIPAGADRCPGIIELCPHVPNADECRRSGRTVFTVNFHGHVKL